MRLPRVIPILLLSGEGLVKTIRFKEPVYVGDPVNTVRIFNEKEVDEIVLLDIDATREQRPPRLDLVGEVASECFMPLCFGGGIRDMATAEALFRLGVEKVALNTVTVERPEVLREASAAYGRQSVVASIDVKKDLFGRYVVHTHGGRRSAGVDPVTHARRVEELGAGEIILTSIDREGTRSGYDLELTSRVTRAVGIPVIAAGGAGSTADLRSAVREGGAAAAAAGSFFVLQGRHRAVLITCPSRTVLEDLFRS